MIKTMKSAPVLLLIAYPLYGQSGASAPVVPVYDQPESRVATEPVPRNTKPYLVPANRNPYFDDPPMRVEGVPTGNPEIPAGVPHPSVTPASGPANDPDSGTSSYTGGIGRNGTDGIRGSGD